MYVIVYSYTAHFNWRQFSASPSVSRGQNAMLKLSPGISIASEQICAFKTSATTELSIAFKLDVAQMLAQIFLYKDMSPMTSTLSWDRCFSYFTGTLTLPSKSFPKA